MPSRAVTSFLPATMFVILAVVSTCVNALTGCYLISTLESLIKFILYMKVCQCPHGLLPHFYIVSRQLRTPVLLACQCPHGLLPHFYIIQDCLPLLRRQCVNALTGCYLISTCNDVCYLSSSINLCQCPHGLLPHFYFGIADKIHPLYEGVSMPSRAVTSFLQCDDGMLVSARFMCQCPHGLLPHFYKLFLGEVNGWIEVCQCPHGLLPHFYHHES